MGRTCENAARPVTPGLLTWGTFPVMVVDWLMASGFCDRKKKAG